MATIVEDRLSSREAAERAGISYRQLDYWLRNGVLGDGRDREFLTGSGSRRRFSVEDVDCLQVLGRLSGLLESLVRDGKTDALADAAARIREVQAAFGRTPSQWWLVMTSGSAHIVASLEQVDELVAGDPGGAVIVGLAVGS